MIQAKPKTTYQRYWKIENPEIRKLDKELKLYQSKTENVKLNTRDTFEVLDLKNQLADSERINKELERDIKVLEKMKARKQKGLQKLKKDTEYEDKVTRVLDEIHKKKSEFK